MIMSRDRVFKTETLPFLLPLPLVVSLIALSTSMGKRKKSSRKPAPKRRAEPLGWSGLLYLTFQVIMECLQTLHLPAYSVTTTNQ